MSHGAHMTLADRCWWQPGLLGLVLLLGHGGGLGACGDSLPPNPAVSASDQELPPTQDRPEAIEQATPEPETTVFAIRELNPTRGPFGDPVQVEVHGSGFTHGMQVYFGESRATDTLMLTPEILVTATPPRPPGLVDVTVFTADGEDSVTLRHAYLYDQTLKITDISPATGHVLGGDALTINGAGFGPSTAVMIGTRHAVHVQVIDSNTIHAVAPDALKTGLVDITVSNEHGVDRLDDAYTYYAPVRIDAVNPPAALMKEPVRITLQGDGFLEPLIVRSNGVTVRDVRVLDPTHLSLLLEAPQSPGPVTLEIATSFGSVIASEAFTWLGSWDAERTPELLALWPPVGPRAGGELVTLVLDHLPEGSMPVVRFGASEAELVTVSPESHALVVRSPPGDVGPVSVTVALGAQVVQRPEAYRYEGRPRVVSLDPASGPTEGGTELRIIGDDFSADAVVRIGPFEASNVRLDAEGALLVQSPPGAPGPANVSVIQSGHVDTLINGYAYTADALALWLVEPPIGTVAGGSLITLRGSGFSPQAQVSFGAKGATDLVHISPTEIRVRTPAEDPGSVAVTLRNADGVQVALPKGFTYYNPTAYAGGTWGQEIHQNLYVSVLDAGGQPLSDAFVWLGDGTGGQGLYTDANGHATFTGVTLFGEQTITATKPEYDRASIVHFNATNATLLLRKPSEGVTFINEIPRGYLEAQVIFNTKYLPVPIGSCEQVSESLRPWCEPCATDTDCPGGLCVNVPGEGAICTQPCQSDLECDADYRCLPVEGELSLQCLPSAGEWVTYCDIANPHEFAFDWVPSPGIEPDADGRYELLTPLGEFATFCWTGLAKDGRFQPKLLGVARHLMATADGERVYAQVPMIHPVDLDLDIALDRPRIGADGEQDITAVQAFLNLGPEGVIDFPRGPEGHGFATIPSTLVGSLSGVLHGTSYSFVASARSLEHPEAVSQTWQRNVSDLRPDTAWRQANGVWEAVESGIEQTIYGLTRGPEGFVAVGEDGQIIHSLAATWARQYSPSSETLYAVDTGTDGTLMAAGARGVVLRQNGDSWQALPSPSADDLVDLSVNSAQEAWLVGANTLWTWNGTSWLAAYEAPVTLHAVLHEANTVWIAGDAGFVARLEPTMMTVTVIETPVSSRLNALAFHGDSTLFAAGEAGVVIAYQGGQWQIMDTPTVDNLHDLWVGPQGVYVVGDRGLIMRHDDSGQGWLRQNTHTRGAALRAIAGDEAQTWALGSHELVLGPMLAIPTDFVPPTGETLGGDRLLRWRTEPFHDPHMAFMQITSGFYTDWTLFLGDQVDQLYLPDLSALAGNGMMAGGKGITMYRVLGQEPFSVHAFDYAKLRYDLWLSWAQMSTSMTVP